VKSLVVSNENRPFDVISFLANDDWIVDDTKQTSKGPGALGQNSEEFSASLRDSDGGVVSPGQGNGTAEQTLAMELAREIELQQREDAAKSRGHQGKFED